MGGWAARRARAIEAMGLEDAVLPVGGGRLAADVRDGAAREWATGAIAKAP